MGTPSEKELIEIDLKKSVEENATAYFENAKLARRKIEGIKKALVQAEKKLAEQKEKKETAAENQAQKKIFAKKREKKWFEKYRWFVSSDGFLVIGGRDAHSNEEIVKKRVEKDDVYFHADVFGAPHCIIKTAGKIVPEQTMKEAAQFAVTFSKAWEENRAHADAYSVKPEQVSKKAPSGESMGAGAFMIYGERNWFRNSVLNCAIGFYEKENVLMAAPFSAAKKNCVFFVEVRQGSKKKSDAAKELRPIFEKNGYSFSVDDFVSALPNGTLEILKK
ncbi:MAG: NFACT RNA binding domain-containing protein [Candidatus Diapherotrites archaeon]|nr:NFACT RNA binding domain-containing protein [Candidatus Diapherotrites archaeon]